MKNMLVRGALLGLIIFGCVSWSVGAQDDIDLHRRCDQCGMDRKAYGYSRMLVNYEEGGSVGVCSLHCAIVERDAHKERKVRSLFVADRDSRKLIDAEKAVWVTGGKKRAVMSRIPTWAFETEHAAKEFIASYGGSVVSWEKVVAAASEEAATTPH